MKTKTPYVLLGALLVSLATTTLLGDGGAGELRPISRERQSGRRVMSNCHDFVNFVMRLSPHLTRWSRRLKKLSGPVAFELPPREGDNIVAY
jgi:hypothetical protein